MTNSSSPPRHVQSDSDLTVVSTKRKSTLLPDIKAQDAVIAVLGMTGGGKSSFIQACTGDENVLIGKSLKSKTSLSESFAYTSVSKRAVWLIDTPGFDDTYQSPIDVLADISAYLSTLYDEKFNFTGIIYLQSIDKTRVGGMEMKNLEMLKALVGDDDKTMKRVVLVTTFWDKCVNKLEGRQKETEFITDKDFWGPFSKAGSPVYQLIGEVGTPERKASIISVVESLVKSDPVTLQIQREMVDQHQLLPDTSAGEVLYRDINAERKRFANELKVVQEEYQKAIAKGQEDLAQKRKVDEERLLKKQQAFEKKVQRIQQNYKVLAEDRDRRIAELLDKVENKQAEMRAAVERLSEMESRTEATKEHIKELQASLHNAQTQNASLAERDARRDGEIRTMIAQAQNEIAAREEAARREAERLASDRLAQQMYQPQANMQGAGMSTAMTMLPVVFMLALVGLPLGGAGA